MVSSPSPGPAAPSPRFSLFLAASLCMSIFGVVLALPGAALGLADVRARLGLDLAQQGQMILLVFAGLAVATLIVGPLIDRFGTRRVLAVSALVIAGGLVLFAAARGEALVALAMITLGIGAAGINTAANVLVSEAYGPARGPMLNRLAISAGLGGVLLPLLTALTVGVVPVRGIALLFAALGVGAAGWTMRLTFPRIEAHASLDLAAIWRIGRLPGLWLFGVLLLLEAANEATMAGFTSTYGQEIGLTPTAATWVLSAHWAALIAGRAVIAGMLERIGKRRVALRSAAAALASALVLVLVPTPLGLAIAAVAMGLALSVIFPTIVALAGERYARNAGTVFGWLLAVAQLGGIVFPSLAGAIAQQTSVRAAMGVVVFTTAALLALAIPVTRSASR